MTEVRVTIEKFESCSAGRKFAQCWFASGRIVPLEKVDQPDEPGHTYTFRAMVTVYDEFLDNWGVDSRGPGARKIAFQYLIDQLKTNLGEGNLQAQYDFDWKHAPDESPYDVARIDDKVPYTFEVWAERSIGFRAPQ